MISTTTKHASVIKKVSLLFASAALTTFSLNAATLVENVKGYTLNNDGQLITFTNMVMDDGKVLALNSEKDAYPITKTINGGGKVMLPGLIDAHGHLLSVRTDAGTRVAAPGADRPERVTRASSVTA